MKRTIHDQIEKVIASAPSAGRDKTLAALSKIQDEAFRILALGQEAFDEDAGDAYGGSRIIGYDVGGPFAPALCIREGDGIEYALPVSIERTSGGGQRVKFGELVHVLTSVKPPAIATASRRESARITATADTAQAAGLIDPFHVTLRSAEEVRQSRLRDAAKRGTPTLIRGPRGLEVTIPTDSQIASAKARAKAALDKTTSAKKLDAFGEPMD